MDFNSGPEVPFPWGYGYWPVPFSSDEALQIAGLFHQGQFRYCSGYMMRQGESDIFQISTWKAFLLLKIYLLWKIRPISVKRWKPVWIRACPIDLLVNLQQLAIVRLNVGTSDCKSRTFFIMNFWNFLRWKSKSWKTTVWDSNGSNKTGMGFALSRDLFYFVFFVAAAEFRLGFGRC